MLEQVSFPFADSTLPDFSNYIVEGKQTNPFRWMGVVILIILFLAGGFLYVLYKQKQKEQAELENTEKENKEISDDNV